MKKRSLILFVCIFLAGCAAAPARIKLEGIVSEGLPNLKTTGALADQWREACTAAYFLGMRETQETLSYLKAQGAIKKMKNDHLFVARSTAQGDEIGGESAGAFGNFTTESATLVKGPEQKYDKLKVHYKGQTVMVNNMALNGALPAALAGILTADKRSFQDETGFEIKNVAFTAAEQLCRLELAYLSDAVTVNEDLLNKFREIDRNFLRIRLTPLAGQAMQKSVPDATAKAAGASDVPGFDGLIIDAAWQGFKIVLLPKIISLSGTMVYDPGTKVPKEILVEKGAGVYGLSQESARTSLGARGVKSPVIIKAIGTSTGDTLLVSDEDGERILYADRKAGFLGAAKVGFVITK